jgi:hypothetical protein
VLIGFSVNAQNTKLEVLKEFVSGVVDFKDEFADLGQPIRTINKLAEQQADKAMDLTKDNINECLELAKSYKTCIITVDVHTIIKITDLEDCSPSGAWGASMPMAKGYVQKAGVLNEKNDYIKNIIGRPGADSRKIFFFN